MKCPYLFWWLLVESQFYPILEMLLELFSCDHLIGKLFSSLARVHATGQEERSKPESSAAKALLLTSSGAREQEPEQESEWQNPVHFKENYPPPRTCRSLIGCSPSAKLSSRGRQSTWSGELPLAHAQIICLPLRTQDVSAILQRRMWGRLPTVVDRSTLYLYSGQKEKNSILPNKHTHAHTHIQVHTHTKRKK